MTKFSYTILAVKDLEPAKEFYIQYFDQELDVNMGALIGFKSGLALWEETAMGESAEVAMDSPFLKGRGGMEIEFHTEDLQGLYQRLLDAGVSMVHGIKTHPWGQQMFRCQDLDGHYVEVDEYLWVTAKRLTDEGKTIAEISEIFGISLELAEGLVNKK